MEAKGLPGLGLASYSRKDLALLLSKLSTAFAVPRPALRFVSTHKWSGLWTPGAISLSTDPRRTGCSPMTLVHEFAHHVMYEWEPRDLLEGHGPEFVGVYGDCLGMAGLIPWYGWQELCVQYKVRCLNTADVSTVTGLRKLVKKRAAEAARKAHPTKI